jgi:hypothetical protein
MRFMQRAPSFEDQHSGKTIDVRLDPESDLVIE